MESNTILVNKTIIPLSNIETLSEYQLVCMFKILAFESYYINIKCKMRNSISSETDYEKRVKIGKLNNPSFPSAYHRNMHKR
jgi:hypothetical protein